MATTRIEPVKGSRGVTRLQVMRKCIRYAVNPEKTDGGTLVSSYMCDPEDAARDFELTHRQYALQARADHSGGPPMYWIRQSFLPGEVTPEEANRIGYELAMQFTHGEHAFVVATHTDRPHIHNHILFCSVTLDCQRKFQNTYRTCDDIARLSDEICRAHNLSVVHARPPEKWEEKKEYQISFRDQIRAAIDRALEQNPKDWEELVALLREAGYEYKPGAQPALRGPGQERFVRFRSLGEGYSVVELEAVLAGETEHKPRVKPYLEKQASRQNADPLVLVTLEEKIEIRQAAIMKTYKHGTPAWSQANRELKQAADALYFFRQNGVVHLHADAEQKIESLSNRNSDLLQAIRADEAVLKENRALLTQVGNYKKASPVLEEYNSIDRRRKRQREKFWEAHQDAFRLHDAAATAIEKWNQKNGTEHVLPDEVQLLTAIEEAEAHKKQLTEAHKAAAEDLAEWKRNLKIYEDFCFPERTAVRERQPER